MSPRSTDEILIGPGTLYVAAEATAFPADPTVTPGAGWADIGYSEEGWTVAIDREFENVSVAEELDDVDVRHTRREAHVRGTLAQASMELLKEAMGGGTIVTGTPVNGKTYTPPADVLTRKAVLFRASAPTVAAIARKRDWQFFHMLAVGAVELAATKNTKHMLAIDFRALKRGTDELFKVIDMTGP
jgi:hypothetical protein